MSNASPSPGPSRFHRAWVMWGMGAVLFSYGFFHRVAPSVMVDDLMRDFTVGAAVLGNLSALYFYPYALMQVPAGTLIDAYGPKRILMASAVCSALGAFTFAQAETLPMAYLGRFLIGFGAGFTFVATLKLAAIWFPADRFAMMSGMTMASGVLGGVFGQAPLAYSVDALGWRETLAAAGVFAVVWGVVIWAALRDDPNGSARLPRSTSRSSLHWGAALTQGKVWVAAVAAFGVSAVLLTFGALWAVPFLQTAHDLSRTEAAGLNSLLLIGSAIGAPLLGWGSDRLGRRRLPFTVSAILLTVCFAVLIYVPGLSVLEVQVLMFLTGLFSGSVIICHAIARERSAPENEAASVGLVNGLNILSGAICQPLVGLLLDYGWQGDVIDGARVYHADDYHLAFLILIGTCVLAVFAAVAMGDRNDPSKRYH